MKRTRLLLLIAASALLLGIGAVACGDDDDDDGGNGGSPTSGSVSAGAYLREVNDIQEGVSTATDAIGEQSDQAFSDPAKARQSLSAAVDVADSAVTALKALDVPSDVSAEHARLIAAGQKLVTVATGLIAQLQGMQPGPAFDTLSANAQADDSQLSKAIDEMVNACKGLQLWSEENKTGVDLACPAPR